MTIVYLAWSDSATQTLAEHADEEPVDILVAYPVLKAFLKRRASYNVRRWCLDSGAFSVFNSGKTIKPEDYHAAAKEMQGDAAEIFALDVIRDAEASQRNTEAAWEQGIHAIPTFHQGEPWSALEWCVKHAPKIAVSGKMAHKKAWLLEVFRRVFPVQVHGFAYCSPDIMGLVPFHSVDATSWLRSPQQFGNYAGYTGSQVAIRARGIRDFWGEVREHQRRARYFEVRWRKALQRAEEHARSFAIVQ